MSMIRFWEAFTHPLMLATRPKLLVEIGADFFLHTNKLLDFCRANEGLLLIIDPAPKLELSAIPKKYHGCFEFE